MAFHGMVTGVMASLSAMPSADSQADVLASDKHAFEHSVFLQGLHIFPPLGSYGELGGGLYLWAGSKVGASLAATGHGIGAHPGWVQPARTPCQVMAADLSLTASLRSSADGHLTSLAPWSIHL